jgi:aldose 1-epimerase
VSRGGAEHVLRHGGYAAVATEVGGGIRLLTHEGRDLVRRYDADQVRPRFRGSLLVPWPNRVADGRYSFAGEEHQLALTEPERGNALHGLVCWVRFDLLEHGPESVVYRHRLVPQQGYPFELDVTVRHELGDEGLTTEVVTRNVGGRAAPYGVAPHPYLVADGPLDEWVLRLPASRVLEVTPDRLLPTALSDVDADRDFRTARPIGRLELDHAFTGLSADPDDPAGRTRVTVAGRDGRGVQVTWDGERLPWLQVHTGDLPAEPEETRRGLAVEPMTCAPDAFRSGDGLVVLEPDEEHRASWTVGALPDS